MKKTLLLFVAALTILISSCSKGREIIFTTDEITMTASGPIMEGSNTATAEINLQLSDFLQKNATSLAELAAVKLSKATFMLPDTVDTALMSEVTLQLAADNAAMQKVAVLNPVPEGKKIFDLQVAQEQKDLEKTMKQDKVTFVADFNAKKEIESDLVFKGKFEFILTLK
jgi:hypothetical protein